MIDPIPANAARPPRNWRRMIGRAIVFVWFFLGGIGHFILTKTFG